MTYRSCSAPQPMIFYTLQLQHQQIFYKIILVPCLIIIGNAGTGSSNRIARRVAYKREQHATTTLLIFLTTTRTDATSNFIIHDSSHGWLVPKMRDWLHLLFSVPYTSNFTIRDVNMTTPTDKCQPPQRDYRIPVFG